jgi:hypothetical protein
VQDFNRLASLLFFSNETENKQEINKVQRVIKNKVVQRDYLNTRELLCPTLNFLVLPVKDLENFGVLAGHTVDALLMFDQVPFEDRSLT